MVIAPILDQQGLSLMVPEYIEQNQTQKESKILEIAVTQDNRYLINEIEISKEELFNTIKEKSQIKSDGI